MGEGICLGRGHLSHSLLGQKGRPEPVGARTPPGWSPGPHPGLPGMGAQGQVSSLCGRRGIWKFQDKPLLPESRNVLVGVSALPAIFSLRLGMQCLLSPRRVDFFTALGSS